MFPVGEKDLRVDRDKAYKIYHLFVLHFLNGYDSATPGLLQYRIVPHVPVELADLEQCLALMVEKQEVKPCGVEKAYSDYRGQPLYRLSVIVGEIDPTRYRPCKNDISAKVLEPGVFALSHFDGKQWGPVGILAQEQAEWVMWVMDFLFEDEKGQSYYRPVAGRPDPFEDARIRESKVKGRYNG
jgi:hypothetical protein